MPVAVETIPLSMTPTGSTDAQPKQLEQSVKSTASASPPPETSDVKSSAALVSAGSLDFASASKSGSIRSTSPGDDGPLFQKKLPSLRTTVFPVRFLGHWFSRRFNVFPRKWHDTIDISADTSADSSRSNSSSSSHTSSTKGSTNRRRVTSDPGAMATLVLDGMVYGESPRFRPHEQAMYFSDMYGKQVVRVDLATGERETVYEDESDFLSGLGWLPDGRMLIVSMNKRAVLVHDRETSQTTQYADVSAVTQARANDMVVSTTGRAYLGNFGFLVEDFAASCTTTLVSIAPDDQHVRVEASGLMFPNGAVITPDGSTLIVAETFDGQLTAFTIRVDDGRLTNRRVWAKLGVPIDGICLDAKGCVWVSVPQVGLYETSGGLLRVREGGAIVNMLGFGRNGIRNGVFACQLATDAGTGQHKLYFMEAPSCKESDIFKKSTSRKKTKNANNGVTTTRKGTLKSIPVRVGPARSPDNGNYSGGYC